MLKRSRGMLLRLIRRRALAVAAGVALLAPAAWLEFSGSDRWWVDGAALVMGATGLALIWTGIAGVQPDWIDPNA